MTLPNMTDTGPVMEFVGESKIYPLDSGNVTALVDISLQYLLESLLPSWDLQVQENPPCSMGCLDVPKGEVYIRGRTRSLSDDQLTTLRRDELGFIFQQFNLIPFVKRTRKRSVSAHPEEWDDCIERTMSGCVDSSRSRPHTLVSPAKPFLPVVSSNG